MHLDDGFRKFFSHQGRYPRFKSRYGKQSLSYPQRVKIVEGNALYLPKVGTVKAVLHHQIVGRIKTVAVSCSRTDKYFASILWDDGQSLPEPARTLCIAPPVSAQFVKQ